MLLAISKKRLRLQFKGGFNSRAASNGDFTVYALLLWNFLPKREFPYIFSTLFQQFRETVLAISETVKFTWTLDALWFEFILCVVEIN